jgi:hypothetical protein
MPLRALGLGDGDRIGQASTAGQQLVIDLIPI